MLTGIGNQTKMNMQIFCIHVRKLVCLIRDVSHGLPIDDVPSMQSVVIDETFQDMDKDRNGRVTLEEYLSKIEQYCNCYGHIFFIDDLQLSYSSDDNSWRERETEYFNTQRDKNGDGVLDKEEVGLWFYPPNTDPSVNEAKHLIYHADENKVF